MELIRTMELRIVMRDVTVVDRESKTGMWSKHMTDYLTEQYLEMVTTCW